MPMECVLIHRPHKGGESPAQQVLPLDPEEGRRGEIGFENHPGRIHGQVAHGGKVIQVGVLVSGHREVVLRAPQFLVLQF
jgi:hypothetical protein